MRSTRSDCRNRSRVCENAIRDHSSTNVVGFNTTSYAVTQVTTDFSATVYDSQAGVVADGTSVRNAGELGVNSSIYFQLFMPCNRHV